MGKCVFGDRCQRSHKRESKEDNVNHSYNEGSSNSYKSPVANGIARSDNGSAGAGEDVQENIQDSLSSGHVLDPPLSEEIDIDEEYVEPEVQDNGSSQQDDVLNPTPLNINIDEEDPDKATCVFFLEGYCGSGSDCDFSHSILKDTKTNRRKGTKSSKSYLYSFFIPNLVAYRIAYCAKALRLAA
jgi:hypothetical protein